MEVSIPTLLNWAVTHSIWLLIAPVVYVFLLCVYRLTLHPLARYPGPWLAKLTTWYSVYHAKKGDLHVDIWRCHEKYGKVIRYAPHRLVINTSTGLQDIYGFGKTLHKPDSYHRISLIRGVDSTLSAIDKGVHGRKRRILSQGLSDRNLKLLEPALLRVVDRLCSRLGENQDDFSPRDATAVDGWTCAKNMAEWSDFYTFDVMSELVFGRSYHMLEKKDSHFIIDCIMAQMRRMSILTQSPTIEDFHLGRFLYPGALQRALRFSMASRSMMEARQAEGKTDGRDICSKLLSAKDPETGDGFEFRELWAESNLLIIAGADTTSTAMAAAFFYLSRCHRAYSRLVAEIRDTFPTIEDVRPGNALSSCKYFRACLDEAMRLSPPVAGSLWRETDSSGAVIDGCTIPAGQEVGTGIYALHHNAEYFPQPFDYLPERWIVSDNNTPEAVRKAQSGFAPFSIGPRSCVGRSLAVIELTVGMARVLWSFDIRAAPGPLGRVGEGLGERGSEFQTKWCFTSAKDGPYIQFRRRSY